jgi:hypothetical protein
MRCFAHSLEIDGVPTEGELAFGALEDEDYILDAKSVAQSPLQIARKLGKRPAVDSPMCKFEGDPLELEARQLKREERLKIECLGE